MHTRTHRQHSPTRAQPTSTHATRPQPAARSSQAAVLQQLAIATFELSSGAPAAQVIDNEEETPQRIVQAAQLSYSKADGWIDHATATWIEAALGLVTTYPEFVPAVGRLLARVGYSWHQGNRSAASVLEALQVLATPLTFEHKSRAWPRCSRLVSPVSDARLTILYVIADAAACFRGGQRNYSHRRRQCCSFTARRVS